MRGNDAGATTMLGVFQQNARNDPHAIFLRDLYRDQTLTYGQAAGAVRYIARLLLEHQRGSTQSPSSSKPSLLALSFDCNDPFTILGTLAAWSIGWSVGLVSATETTPLELFAAQLQCLTPSLIIASGSQSYINLFSAARDAAFQASGSDSVVPSISLNDFLNVDPSEDVTLDWYEALLPPAEDGESGMGGPADRHQEAYRLFTSSAINVSTVKAASLSHAVLYDNTYYWNRQDERLARRSHTLGLPPLSHSAGFQDQMCISALATCGSYIFVEAAKDKNSLSRAMLGVRSMIEAGRREVPCNAVWTIPIFVEAMTACTESAASDEESREDREVLLSTLRQLNYMIVVGAAVGNHLLQWASTHGIPLAVGWGMTEAQFGGCVLPLGAGKKTSRAMSINKEIFSHIDDEGQLLLKGKTIMSGYWRVDPKGGRVYFDSTDDAFETGDNFSLVSAEASKGGGSDAILVEYLGRVDDTIQLVNGEKALATEIEASLASTSVIRQAYVTGNSTSADRPSASLVALVELNNGGGQSEEELAESLGSANERLAPASRIALQNVKIVASLPTTTKGLPFRKRIRQDFAEDILDLQSACAGRIALETLDSTLKLDCPAAKSQSLTSLALSSIQAARLVKVIETMTGVAISVVELIELDTVGDLEWLVVTKMRNPSSPAEGGSTSARSSGSTSRRPSVLASALERSPPRVERKRGTAIRGIGLRLPGNIRSKKDAWNAFYTLRGPKGEDILSLPPKGRKFSDKILPNTFGGWLSEDDVKSFDPRFFGIDESEAIYVKPQQRLALEVAYEALEDALIVPSSLRGQQVGIFCAASGDDGYDLLLRQEENESRQSSRFWGHGTHQAALAGRLAHYLGTEGPVMTIETACSGGLVAMYSALRALDAGDCDIALVGGITTHFDAAHFEFMQGANMTTKQGHSQAFGSEADGMMASEGVVFMVLQRPAETPPSLSQAVVQHVATQHQGVSSNMLMTRSDAQARLMSKTMQRAGIDASDIDLIETHGTGTKLGDAVEACALMTVFQDKARQRAEPVIVSSSKTVFGHTEEASGLVGLLKAILVMQHRACPPHQVAKTDDSFSWPDIDAVIPRQEVQLDGRSSPLHAVVSSFGFSGIMACAAVEGPVEGAPSRSADGQALSISPPIGLLLLSAPDEPRLRRLAEASIDWLKDATRQVAGKEVLSTLMSTINSGRDVFSTRRAVSFQVDDHWSLMEKLQQMCSSSASPSKASLTKKRILVQFSGIGKLDVNVARDLFEKDEAFRSAFHEAAREMAKWTEVNLEQVLYPPSEAYVDESAHALTSTVTAQACQFVLSYALWHSVRPYVTPSNDVSFIGHSFGEVVAATAAGVLSLADAAELVHTRSLVCAEAWTGASPGAMLGVRCSLDKIESMLAESVVVAAVNDAEAVTLSGPKADIEELQKKLDTIGIPARRLNSQHVAFHHPRLGEHLSQLEKLPFCRANIDGISNFRSCSSSDGKMLDWARHLTDRVQYQRTVDHLCSLWKPHQIVEIGPASELTGLLKRRCKSGSMPGSAPLLTSICDSSGKAQLGDMLGSLFEAGSAISWPFAFQRGNLRTTVFERRRFWPGKQVAPAPRGGIIVETPYTPDSVGSPNPVFESSKSTSKEGRPLLGKINRGTHPTLAQHIVRGKAILPLAGFVEAALEDCQERLAIENLEVHQAFELLEEGQDAALSIRKEDQGGVSRFTFISVTGNDDDVALGSFTKSADATAEAKEEVVDMVAPEHASAIDLGRFFSGGWKDFAAFGPAFQKIEKLSFDEKRVWCDIRNWEPKEADEEEGEKYHIHPALLDAFFQSASALFVGDGSLTPGEYLLPVSLASFRLLRAMPDCNESATLKGQIELVEWRRDDFSADIYAFDLAGVPLFVCRGLRLKVMRGSPRETHLEGGVTEEEATYKTIWQPASAPLSDPCEQASMIPDAVIPELGSTLGAQLDAHVTKLVYDARDRIRQISAERKDRSLHLGRYKQLLEDLIRDYEEGKTTKIDTSLLREREPVLLEAAERICSVLDQALVDPTAALEVLLAGDFGQQLYSAGWRPDLQEFAEGKIRDELRRLASSDKQVIRLIEVGAGTGALSRSIARVAQQVEEETGKIIHCTFSDISPSLASRLVDSLRSSASEEKPTRFSWMQYDFDEEAWKQTADLASYDVVLSFSALHAAQKIGSCLSQLQRLLCPGGIMMTFDLDGRAFEQDWPTTRFLNVLTGSLRGWFGFVDDDRKSHCTLSPAGWRDMLARCGYTSIDTLSNISKGPEPYLYISARRGLTSTDLQTGSSSFAYSLGKEMQLKEYLEGMPGWHQQSSEGGSTCNVITESSQDFSAASGIARALRSERPWLRVRVIKAPLGSDSSPQTLEMDSRIDENGVVLVPRIVADNSPERTRPSLDKGKNYFLAGGLTGLGLEVAFWMYTMGARHFVLTSRSGKLQKVEEDKIGHHKATRNLAVLQSMPGVTVLTASCDASSKEQTRNLLDRLPANIPLGGVVLMSAVMDARLFEKQEQSSFDSLYQSKVTPINVMKEVVDVDKLDFLLYFSTFGALMGLSGQSNYYAASLAGEAALAELPNAASISVPAITDVGGFRLELTSQRQKTSASRVKSIFTTSSGLLSQVEGALNKALRRERPATLITHTDWEGLGRELKELNMGVSPSMQHLTSLHRCKPRTGEDQVVRKENVQEGNLSVEALVGAAVQMDPAELDASVPISFYGLDSLDATLLSGKMQQYYGVTISQLRLLSDLTLQQVYDTVEKHGTKPVGNLVGSTEAEEEEEAIMVRPGREPNRSPLFIIHDVMGQTALFRNIDETLTRPLWALQPTTRSKAEKDLIGVAKVYLDSIRRVRPEVDEEGLRIVSYSGSATIALHMAKIQQEAGHKVAQLTLIDYATPLLRLFRRESHFLHPKSYLAEGKKLSIKQLRLRGLLAVERAAEMDSALEGHHKGQISDLVQELVSLAEEDCQGGQSKNSSMRPILDDMPKYFNAIVGEVFEERQGEGEDADLVEAYRLWSCLKCDITLVLAEHGILPALRSLLPSDSPMQTEQYADLGLRAALGNQVKIDTQHIPKSGHFSILFSPALASLLER